MLELEECKVAATQLGIAYGETFTDIEGPAGCVLEARTPTFYFNLANPSDAQNMNPHKLEWRGTQVARVCKKGKSDIFSYVLYRQLYSTVSTFKQYQNVLFLFQIDMENTD